MVDPQSVRRYLLTGAIAAITATGAWYGASLKIQNDYKKERRIRQQRGPEAKIAELEAMRAQLVTKRLGLERKIVEVKARQHDD